jgi:preprotein translocase subunit SecG
VRAKESLSGEKKLREQQVFPVKKVRAVHFMAWYQIALGVTTIVVALVITVLIMLQESKAQGLSGVIAGGVDSMLGKSKGHSFEDKLVAYTKYCAIAFFVLTLGTTLLLLFWNR